MANEATVTIPLEEYIELRRKADEKRPKSLGYAEVFVIGILLSILAAILLLILG